MKNFLIILLFPFLGYGQAPNSMMDRSDQWDEKGRVEERKMFFPNPTYGDLEFNLDLIGHDHIIVSINNILAKELWSQTIDNSNRKIDVGFLVKGTYLLCIRKMDGEVITTRRLAIITP